MADLRSSTAATPPYDPYYELLGIPPSEQPPTHYRLLGLSPFESNPTVIERAADRQMKHLHDFKTGPHAASSQKLLSDIAKARRVLLSEAERTAYDATLSEQAVLQTLPSTVAPLAPEMPPVFPITLTATPPLTKRSNSAVAILATAVAGVCLTLGVAAYLGTTNRSPAVPGESVASEAPAISLPAKLPPVAPVPPPMPAELAPTVPNPPAAETVSESASSNTAASDSPLLVGETLADVPRSVETSGNSESNPLKSHGAALSEKSSAEPTPAQRAALREEVEAAKTALREHPGFQRFYEHLTAKPQSIGENGPKLARIIWEEASNNRTIADHPPSFVAAMEEVERLAVAGGEFSSALQAIDARRNLGPVGLTGAEAVAAKSAVLLAAAEKAAAPGGKAESRAATKAWILDLLKQALRDNETQPFEVLSPAVNRLSKTSSERLDSANALLPLAEQALSEEKLEAAETILAQADLILKPVVGKGRKEIVERLKAARDNYEAADRSEAALRKLAADPEDPEANQIVGSLALEQGKWKTALTHLARGNPGTLQELASATLAPSASSIAKAELAERWTVADKRYASQCQAIARMLYRDALADQQLTGIARAAIEAKAEKLGRGETAHLADHAIGPADASSVVTVGKPISLLPTLRYPEDVVRGDWVVERGNWRTVADYWSQAQVPIPLRDCSYQVQLEFTAVKGERSLGITLPVGDTAVTVFCATHIDRGGLSYFSTIGGLHIDRNPKSIPGRLIEAGKRYSCDASVRLRGDQAEIEFRLDGQRLFDYQGPISELRPHSNWRMGRLGYLGFGSYGSEVVFEKASLTITELAPQRRMDPLPLNEPVDLLATLDLKEDVQHGGWYSRSDGIGVDSSPVNSLCKFPIDLDGCSYDLRIEFAVEKGTVNLNVVIPVGNRATLAVISAWPQDGGRSYFDAVRGQEARGAPEAAKGILLLEGKSYSCHIQVQLRGRDAHLVVSLDGKQLYEYTGPVRDLQTRSDWRLSSSGAAGLGVHGGEILFRKCELTVRAGTPWLTRAEPMPDPRPAEVMQLNATRLTSLQPKSHEQFEGYFGISKSVYRPVVDGKLCDDYVFAHAPSRLVYDIPKQARYFTAFAYNAQSASTRFIVKVDGQTLYSRAWKLCDPVYIELPSGSQQLELIAETLGSSDWDHAHWCYPEFR